MTRGDGLLKARAPTFIRLISSRVVIDSTRHRPEWTAGRGPVRGEGVGRRDSDAGQHQDRRRQWTACICGAEQVNDYPDLIESACFQDIEVGENPQYEFLSDQAADACKTYGVKSLSIGATRR